MRTATVLLTVCLSGCAIPAPRPPTPRAPLGGVAVRPSPPQTEGVPWRPASASEDRRPPAPLAIGLHDGVLIAWPSFIDGPDWGDEPHPFVVAALRGQGLVGRVVPAPPGETVTRSVGGIQLSATAGTLPGGASTPVPISPAACDDRALPARAAGGTATCAASGVVDTWRGPDGRILPIPSTPVRAVGTAPWGLALAGARRGVWAPEGAALVSTPGPTSGVTPVSDGRGLASAEADRVDVGWLGAARWSQLPATPAPTRGSLAVGGGLVAWVQGAPEAQLWLVQLEGRGRGPLLGATDPGWPQLTRGWLSWIEARSVRGLGLAGQGAWSLPLDAGFTDGHATWDDWRLVPSRASGALSISAVHLPTGLAVDLWAEPGAHVSARGADGAGLTAWVRAPGELGALAERRHSLRLLEEDGTTASVGLRSVPGGHGGSQGRIRPGASHEVVVAAGPAARLSVWFADAAPRDGAVRVAQGPRARGQARPEADGWCAVAEVLGGLPTTVTWVADGAGTGLAVDAVKLEPL